MSILANPMILMVVLMGGMSLCLPKLMASVDQDTLNEARGIKKKEGDEEDAGPQLAQIVSPNVFGINSNANRGSSVAKKIAKPSTASSTKQSQSSSSSTSTGKQTTASKDILEMD